MTEPIPNPNNRDKALADCVRLLSEHFETVQIIVTDTVKDGSNDTVRLSLGSGNMYARVESLRMFLKERDWKLRQAWKNEEL